MAGTFWSPKETDLLKRLHADGLTTDQITASFPGRSSSSVRSQMARNGLSSNIPTVEAFAQTDAPTGRLISFLKGKTPRDLVSICDYLELAPKSVKPLLSEIADHPGLIQTEDGRWLIDDVKMDGPEDRTVDLEEARYGRFGVVSDTHLGSKYQQITYLEEAYEHFDKVGVDTILHAGDLTEGDGSLYRGQRFEVFLHGFAAQRDYVVERYPKAPGGAKTRIVSGNHDESWLKSADVNLVAEICDKREDMEYVGRRGAYISLKDGKIKTYLFHPDGGTAYAICFSDDTEIFTDQGWKLFKDLDKSEKALTWDTEKNVTEWQEATDYIAEPYSGEMVHFNTKRLDFIVTPNHRMIVKRPWSDSWQFVQAGKISARQWCVNKTIPGWRGQGRKQIALPIPKPEPHGRMRNYQEQIDSKMFVSFLGWFLSEGNIGHKNKCVEIGQSKEKNPEKYQEIVDLCNAMGFTPYCTETRIKITSRQMYDYFKQFGHSHEKHIPQEFKDMDTAHLKAMLNALFKGDGSMLNGKLQNYTTNSPQLADDIQEIAMKCGMGCTIKKCLERKSNFNQTRPVYQLSIAHKMTTPSIEVEPQRVSYNGMVYCVTVPNETILVRRSGKVMWSGNSYKLQKYIEGFSSENKPQLFLVGHYHKMEQLFLRNIHAFQAGAFEAQTPFMRAKGLPAALGYWLIEWDLDADGVGIGRLNAEFMPKYLALKNDY